MDKKSGPSLSSAGGYLDCFINSSLCLSDDILDDFQRHAPDRQFFRVNDALLFGAIKAENSATDRIADYIKTPLQ